MDRPVPAQDLVWHRPYQNEVYILVAKAKLIKSKEQYDLFTRSIPGLPLFYESWYLDNVCAEGSWDVALYASGKKVEAAWPYFYKKKKGLRYITMPPLTPYLGIIYHPDINELNESKRRSLEKRIDQHLVSQLPQTILHRTDFHPDFENGLPLKWMGFTQTARYTYRLSLNSAVNKLWNQIDPKQRNAITKAKNHQLIELSDDIDSFCILNEKTFKHKGEKALYSSKWFKDFDTVLKEKNKRRLWLAKSVEGEQPIAGIYCVHDKKVAYCLAIGSDLRKRHTGSIAHLLWEAINTYRGDNKEMFDFEGGNIPGIEKFFRSFGSQLKPFYRFTRTKSRVHEILLILLGKLDHG